MAFERCALRAAYGLAGNAKEKPLFTVFAFDVLFLTGEAALKPQSGAIFFT